MATSLMPETLVSPQPESNQQDALSRGESTRIAKDVLKLHKSGLKARRQRDLISEKLYLHIDGSGDLQHAEIFANSRIAIPELISEYKKKENLLRLVVDNAVAHHTTMPLKFMAESQGDRKARDRAMIDSIWMNYVAWQQDLNGLLADAMYMAMATGFCPIHCYWSDDPVDQHEPINHAAQDGPEAQIQKLIDPQPGRLDLWLGNPFDTVFGNAAKRGSAYWCSYARVLPADLVRAKFDHIQGVSGLQGTKKIPSASNWQRIARKWQLDGLGMQGSPVLDGGHNDSEELMVVVCREVVSGYEADWPNGRLQLIAVPETDDLQGGPEGGNALLLADQELPAGDFSWTNIYSHHRGDDILGKPWVEDLDQSQVELNIALSDRYEFTQKMFHSPTLAPAGMVADDMLDYDGYKVIEVEAGTGGWRPTPMKQDPTVLTSLNTIINDLRTAIYTGGGYQASSRGEAAGSRIAAATVQALQRADNSIHGPVNQRLQRSVCDLGQKCWKQMKAFGDVP